MLLTDYLTAIVFAVNGIPGLVEWAEDDTGAVADLKRDRQRAAIASIG